jgi:hypothetical protein
MNPPRAMSSVALPPNFVHKRPSYLLQKTKVAGRAVDPLGTAENDNYIVVPQYNNLFSGNHMSAASQS